MKIQALEGVTEKVAELLSLHLEVLAAYVFGSVAAGRARPNSDVDIAVLLDIAAIPEDLFEYRLSLMAELRNVLKTPDVDVVILNEAPPALAQNVISTGRLIFERSRSGRIRFQIRTLNEFLDTQPMRDTHLKVLKRRYLKE
jgi:predicted nucleotidyltransferase